MHRIRSAAGPKRRQIRDCHKSNSIKAFDATTKLAINSPPEHQYCGDLGMFVDRLDNPSRFKTITNIYCKTPSNTRNQQVFRDFNPTETKPTMATLNSVNATPLADTLQPRPDPFTPVKALRVKQKLSSSLKSPKSVHSRTLSSATPKVFAYKPANRNSLLTSPVASCRNSIYANVASLNKFI